LKHQPIMTGVFHFMETNSQRSLFEDIKASIAGTDLDFTSGSIGRAIFILSIPMVIEMIMESVFAVVDIFFVSKLGAQAVATVGITESVVTIIYAIAVGLAMGTTAIISRRYGEKKYDSASVSAVQAILVGVIASLPLAIIGIWFSKDLLQLMGAESVIVQKFSGYATIMISFNLVIILLFVLNAVFRGAGDAAISMRVLWLANGLNILLDPILIFGWWIFPELGVKGAAIATVIGRSVGVLLQLYYLFKGSKRIRIGLEHLRFRLKIMIRLIRVSLGGIGQFIIATSSWVFLMKIMAEFGSISVAGYTIAVRILIFSILPSWGMSNATATLVGQNLGAEKPERAVTSTWIATTINVLFLGSIGILIFFFSEVLMQIFTKDPEIISIGVTTLKVMSFGYVSYGFGMVIVQALNGAGDTMTPTIINFICFWLIEIPLAYYLALEFGFNETGVVYSIIISETFLAILGFIVFKRGKWKEINI